MQNLIIPVGFIEHNNGYRCGYFYQGKEKTCQRSPVAMANALQTHGFIEGFKIIGTEIYVIDEDGKMEFLEDYMSKFSQLQSILLVTAIEFSDVVRKTFEDSYQEKVYQFTSKMISDLIKNKDNSN